MVGLNRARIGYSRRTFLRNAAFLGAGARSFSPDRGAAAEPAQEAPRLVHTSGDNVSFFAGERPLFEFRYSKTRPKTYVHPLFAPNGAAITLDSPADHVHHRGVMLAWSDVNGFDFWGEQNPAPHGQIIHQRFDAIVERPVPSVTSVNHWMAGGRTLLVERQTVAAPPPQRNAVWLQWTSELTANDGPVSLAAGEHVYNGLGVRFKHSMDRGHVLNANGTTNVESGNGQPAAWCAYWGNAGDGGSCGVAVFDHPENPRHPTPFFVMNHPFGYLSAAPTFRKPFQLDQGETLILRYALLAVTGKPDRAEIGRNYEEWVLNKKALLIGPRLGLRA